MRLFGRNRTPGGDSDGLSRRDFLNTAVLGGAAVAVGTALPTNIVSGLGTEPAAAAPHAPKPRMRLPQGYKIVSCDRDDSGRAWYFTAANSGGHLISWRQGDDDHTPSLCATGGG